MTERRSAIADKYPDLIIGLEFAATARYAAEIVALPPSEREPRALGWQLNGARYLGQLGDRLLFRSSTVYDPSRAAAYNHLARGLAACAVLYGQSPPVGGVIWYPPPRESWAAEPARTQTASRRVETVAPIGEVL